MTHDDLSLMRRLKAGDEQAMAVLLEEHWTSVVRGCFRTRGKLGQGRGRGPGRVRRCPGG